MTWQRVPCLCLWSSDICAVSESALIHTYTQFCAELLAGRRNRKTDRVQANEAVREYVVPDQQRRDDVRWHTRVMMSRCT